jgi:hypothetical protein
MMVNGADELPVKPGELRKFQQLVELQGELVEQARKNEQAEQQCDTLRRDLEREVLRPRRDTPVTTLARRLAGLRDRLVRRLRSRAQRNTSRNGH